MADTALKPKRLRKWRFRALVGIGIVGVVLLLRATVFAPEPIPVRRGDELGVFNLGSTVVLLVADSALAPADVSPGALVRMGEALWRRT